MTIRPLYPAVEPTLNLDFANTKRLDPRISFSRASAGTYFGADGLLKNAAVNEARFDHSPSTGESLGLLVEEARTNSFTYSEEFDNAAWTKTNVSITANSAIAPNGLQVADTLTSSAAGTAIVYRTLAQNPSIFSVYLKANTSTTACVRILSNVVGRNVAYNVNLSNGTISAASGNTGNLTGWTEFTAIQNTGNGWYRVSIGLSSSSNPTSDYEISPSSNRTAAASGESIFIWGAQAEGSTFSTSYIPTVATTVTRSADVAQITGTNFSSWYNQNQSTVLLETKAVDDTGGSGGWYFGPGGSPRWWSYSTGYTEAFDGSGGGGVINTGYSGSRSSIKYAVSINNSAQTHIGAINGNAAANGLWDSILGVTQLDLGYRRDNLEYLNGRISRLSYFPLSLPGSTLQAITL